MSPWQKLLEQPHWRAHLVQLYDTEGSPVRNVSQFLCEGLRRGEGILVIATAEHWTQINRELEVLGTDPSASLARSQVLFLDAQETLAAFMVDGQPDWDRFERTIRNGMRRLHPFPESAGIRAYGEMVALLWKARQFASAIRLEQFWNRLLAQSRVSLYCSYAIDVFSREFHPDAMDALLRAHTHLVPSESDGKLEQALSRAMNDILGPEGHKVQALIRADQSPAWAVMPDAESTLLWIRKNLPRQAEEIFARTRIIYRELTQKGESVSA
ncbi:MAG TPA: MEDS domain-containing protein [Bryobacteraceae bacterium]|nr:MEDS domain-containing protein [Bryobacteraceae bacterium]